MTTLLTFLLTTVVLLAPFALIAALAAASHRSGTLRWNSDQFRVSAPMVGRLFDSPSDLDADARRLDHELDAIRTRFEDHPVWPSSGATGERR